MQFIIIARLSSFVKRFSKKITKNIIFLKKKPKKQQKFKKKKLFNFFSKTYCIFRKFVVSYITV